MDKTLEQCYETLGLSIDATKEEVRKAYKKLALKCHPDKNQNSPEANRKFQELGYAYKRITEDEDLEEIDEDCSEFDYWTEVFFYCLLKEHFQVHRNRKHCCPNCAQYTDEDEEFFEDLYKKHKRKQKEMTFTDEEMKHFVKFNSLKEQREFNKKTFCDTKKSSKPKNEPKVQKVKMKTNKQLKAEQWKREKEMSKIAEEIEIKNKQEEQKKYIKEFEEMKKEKEKLESTKNGIDIKEQVNGNKQQCGTRHKEQLRKENNKSGNTMPTKQKPKKNHKKVRAKAEDNNTQKFDQQEHKTCKSTTPVVTKPATNSSVIKRNPKPSKPVAPVFRPSKLVQQQDKSPTPITLPQPPNIWMKRLETQNEIQEIQPNNEEEELRQLEIALEMSKKQVEIEQQQKQIAALQEEIRLMSLEQENLRVQDTSEDTSEAVAFLPDCEIKSDMLTDVENCNERLGNSNDFNLNEVTTDFQAAEIDEQGKKQLNGSPDAGAVDDSSENECDCTCTHGMDTGSTLCDKYAPVIHEPQNQFFRPKQSSKGQTQACASREKNNAKEKKPCPYGRNCCLGKKCKYSHFVAKGEDGLNHNQSLCSEAKQQKSHDIVDAEIIDEIEHDQRSASGCGIMENNLLVTGDWDNEIENNQVLSSASHLLQGSSSSSSITESEPWQIGQNSYSAVPKDCGKDSNSWEEKEYEKEPVICSEFDVTNEIWAAEDWEHEIEDNGLDPSITGNSFSHTHYPTLKTERPYEELQGYKNITSNHTTPMASNTSYMYTIQPSVPILSGETLSCHGEDKTTLLNGVNREGMSSTCHEETDRNWEKQSHATSIGSMNNVHSQETCREWQDEWEESIAKDAVRMNNEIQWNDDFEKQSRNILQQAVVDDARIKPIPCHQNTVPVMYPVITDSVQCSQKQFQTNPCTKLTLGPQYCLPFPSAGMPGMLMGGTVMHQPGLYNIPQMPSLFMPQLNYPYVQSGGSGVNPQASLLPMPAPGYHPRGSNQMESTSVSATSESGTPKPTHNSSISSTKQVPDLNTPNFPVLPNMCFGFQGNTPNVCVGVPSNMNSVPNIQQGPLMAVPFPVIPGFLPAVSQQPLLPNNLLNMSSTVGKESNNNNLQKLNKLATGPVSDYNVDYQSSRPLNPPKGSANGHTVNGPNIIQPNPFIALESNYHSILEMQINGATPQIDMSCAREHQTNTLNVSQEDRRVETSPSTPVEKKVSESEYMKKNEDMLKMNDIRKPSSVPKALSYAERHQ